VSLCGSCQDNFELNNGTCIEIVQVFNCSDIYKCLECDEYGCTVCDFGYTEVNGSCLLNYCDGKCLKCDDNQRNFCAECISGYTVYSNSFKTCVENQYCISIDDDGCCNKCEDSYTLSSDHICITNKNCRNTNTSGYCIECKEGYRLDDNYYCAKNEHCEEIVDGVCKLCEKGYVLKLEQPLCLKDDDCIKINQTYGYCIQCVTGKTFDYSTDKCTDNPQCETVDEVCDCIKCYNGYSVDPRTQLCIENKQCSTLHQWGYCVGCNNNYVLGDSLVCIQDEHCQNIQDSSCTKCEDGYTVKYDIFTGFAGYCEENHNCSEIDETSGLCRKCEDGYYLNWNNICSNNYCESTNGYFCTRCESGFTLDYSDGECKPNEQCMMIITEGEYQGMCSVCKVGYERNSTTQLCQEYIDRSSIISNDCEEFDKCFECNERGCLSCEYGFDVVDGKCVESSCYDSACLYCDYYNHTTCGDCIDGYYLKDGRCEIIPNKCYKFGNCIIVQMIIVKSVHMHTLKLMENVLKIIVTLKSVHFVQVNIKICVQVAKTIIN